MNNKEVFQATKKIYGLYGAFFKAVTHEVGMEKALELHTQAHEEQGIASGKMLKEKMGDEPFDIEKLGSVLRDSNLSIGIDSELAEADSSSALFRNSRCPMYDGYRMGDWMMKRRKHYVRKVPPLNWGLCLNSLTPASNTN
jgi:hypothetical protein